MQQAIFVLWGVWKCRIALLFRHELQDVQAVIKNTVGSLDEFKQASSSMVLTQQRLSQQVSWTPLLINVFKANFDAALDHGHKRCSVGVVIPHHRGNIFGWRRNFFFNLTCPLSLFFFWRSTTTYLQFLHLPSKITNP